MRCAVRAALGVCLAVLLCACHEEGSGGGHRDAADLGVDPDAAGEVGTPDTGDVGSDRPADGSPDLAPRDTDLDDGDTSGGVTRYGVEVVATYPHDSEAFTQGLVYVDGVLIEGTGLYGESSLRRVELETGRVEQIHDLPANRFGEGVACVGDRVFQLTWLSHTGFIYDLETLEPLDGFRYPTQGWGLTYDGEQLIMSDGTATLYWLDPESLEQSAAFEVRDGAVPVDQLNELEYIDGAIWANVWLTDEIVIISAESGRVVGRIDLSDLPVERPDDPDAVLNGIAYDDASGRIFVTGKRWPQLFEVRLRFPR